MPMVEVSNGGTDIASYGLRAVNSARGLTILYIETDTFTFQDSVSSYSDNYVSISLQNNYIYVTALVDIVCSYSFSHGGTGTALHGAYVSLSAGNSIGGTAQAGTMVIHSA